MEKSELACAIAQGATVLGIEVGSTRIKAVLAGRDHAPLAAGSFAWESRLEDGYWTYSLEAMWEGLRSCYGALARDVEARYGVPLETVGAIGVSAMMHGYLAFDADGALLCPFRTWRNTTTEAAAQELTALFGFNVPQRWSVAHLHQAVLNREPHVGDIRFITTLAGYVHWKLTGARVLGVGDASGMFPIAAGTVDYDAGMLEAYEARVAGLYPWKLGDLLPKTLAAGAEAGALTQAGAKLLDPSGRLKAGIPFCPPEGDAGTGMVATNSVAKRTGNISAGTSIFAMVVLEKPLASVYPQIDLVTTPSGSPVAMVHCNNCTNEINAWAGLFLEFAQALGLPAKADRAFETLFAKALEGEADAGGLVLYNYLAGEPIVGLQQGRPLLARTPEARLTLANFTRAQLFGAVATLRLGMDILMEREGTRVDRLLGHGGFFKTPEAGQRVMAAALGTPISVLETAGEGGAWGMALLAAYRAWREPGETLEGYLEKRVFAGRMGRAVTAEPEELAGFTAYLERYRAGLAMERAAVEALP